MAVQMRGLGKGLDALFKTLDQPGKADEVVHIELGSVAPNPNQPRKTFVDASLQELADSIKAQGLLQPILVRPAPVVGAGGTGRFELVAGERRLRASQIAGLTSIPALVKHISDEESLVIAIIENLQREDLNAVEEAGGLKALQDRLKISQEELAKRVGKSRPAVANTLRLLHLPLSIQDDVRKGVLSAGHARALLGVEHDEDRMRLRDAVVSEEYSVRRTERAAAYWRENGCLPEEARSISLPKPEKERAPKEDLYSEAAAELAALFDVDVRIQGNGGNGRGGKIVFRCDGPERLETLLRRFGVHSV